MLGFIASVLAALPYVCRKLRGTAALLNGIANMFMFVYFNGKLFSS